MDKFKEAFREEAYELLEELEYSLLDLEKDPEDKELINKVFRALHTIKGSAAMFGFNNVSSFTHKVENIYDKVREKKIKLTNELMDLTLEIKDQIRVMLDPAGESEDSSSNAKRLLDELMIMFPEEFAEKESKQQSLPEQLQKNVKQTFRIRFKPPKDIFLKGTNPLLLINELRSMGELAISAHLGDIPSINNYNPEFCYIRWDMVLTTLNSINSIKDVFIFIEETSEIEIETIDYGSDFDSEVDYKKLGEILIERGEITYDELVNTLNNKKPLGEILKESKLVNPEEIESALAEQKYMRKLKEDRQKKLQSSSIRVKSIKLDSLVDLVGELVTAQAQLTQTASSLDSTNLSAISEEIERISTSLRDNTMSIRMLPIGMIFNQFNRLVRDLSNNLGKTIELVIEGAETELDKTVIEKLNDPLVHLIRNCIDHGIENPDVRKKIGKPPVGKIYLCASHEGAHVKIEIEDDGKGMDKNKILKNAEKKGIISPGEKISDEEIYSFIFNAGFSTVDKVTEISGRGVGMDVVKRSIDNLGGQIIVKSTSGKGTIITLKLPLTLAIIEGLLVEIEEQSFVIPLSAVRECIELSNEEEKRRQIINVRGKVLPYIKLRDLFEINTSCPEIQQIVIINVMDKQMGLVVDKVIGGYQTVIKPLSKIYKDVKIISGATILGDGTVALILDVVKIQMIAEAEERNRVLSK